MQMQRPGHGTEIVVDYLGDARFAASTRGHVVIADQPYDNGGTDTAMTPPELLLASLGTCAGYYASQYLNARGLPTEGLRLHLSGTKGTQPARFTQFQVVVTVPGMDGRHVDGLLRAVKACIIHYTLQHQPHVDFEVRVENPSEVVTR